MARVNWTEQALADLSEVADFISEQSLDQASEIVKLAFARAETRVDFPESGAIVPELDVPHIREVQIKDTFRLIYEIIDDEVFVIAFVRHSRRILRMLKERKGRSTKDVP